MCSYKLKLKLPNSSVCDQSSGRTIKPETWLSVDKNLIGTFEYFIFQRSESTAFRSSESERWIRRASLLKYIQTFELWFAFKRMSLNSNSNDLNQLVVKREHAFWVVKLIFYIRFLKNEFHFKSIICHLHRESNAQVHWSHISDLLKTIETSSIRHALMAHLTFEATCRLVFWRKKTKSAGWCTLETHTLSRASNASRTTWNENERMRERIRVWFGVWISKFAK